MDQFEPVVAGESSAVADPLASPAATGQEEAATGCLRGFGVAGALAAADVVAMSRRLTDWVAATYPGARWLTETPLTAPAEAGGRWNGVADLLLLRLPDGGVVVVDHTSEPLRRPACAAKALENGGQLEAYREALAALGLQVRAVWVHFPLPATLVRLGASPSA